MLYSFLSFFLFRRIAILLRRIVAFICKELCLFYVRKELLQAVVIRSQEI